ncbi:MAG: hypothetical protein K9J38_09685 [Polynucleobacter sp.]|jgi:hypothetical protein|nr:hypothetical protein [Polynucleobacter sp.]
MSMPIPSGLANLPVMEVRRSTDIPPTNPTTGVNGVTPIDPRQALQMAEPVLTAEQSSLARESLQRNFQENLNPNNRMGGEPITSQAVLLEISNTSQRSLAGSMPGSTDLMTDSAQDIASNLIGLVKPQNSQTQITSPEVVKLNQLIATVLQNSANSSSSEMGQVQNAVQWPGMIPSPVTQLLGNTANVALQSQLMTNALTANDPKTAMTNLKNDLKNSGLFAAEQLAQVLMPSSEDRVSQMPTDNQRKTPQEMTQVATGLLRGLESNSQQLIDSIKLALKGDLVWQGMLLPQVPATMVREDAWQANPQDPSQIEKGTRIAVAITLPNLGMIQVIGTQFRDQLHVAIEVPETSKFELQSQIEQLQINLKEQVPIDANIQLKDTPRG